MPDVKGGLTNRLRESAPWLVTGFFLVITNVKFPLTTFGIVLAVLSYSSVVACVAVVALRKRAQQKRVGWRGWLTVPLLALSLSIVNSLVTGSATPPGADAAESVSATRQTLAALVAGVGMILLVGPFTEEWLLRGWLLPARAGVGAILLNALLFSLAHDVRATVPVEVVRGYAGYFVSGLGLAVARRVTGNTWYSFAVHAIMNLFVGGLLVIENVS